MHFGPNSTVPEITLRSALILRHFSYPVLREISLRRLQSAFALIHLWTDDILENGIYHPAYHWKC